MELDKRSGNEAVSSRSPALQPMGPRKARVLLVSKSDSVAEPVARALAETGAMVERAETIADGLESAKSGRFQLILTTPFRSQGSWRRLIDIDDHYHAGFVVVVLAKEMDLRTRTEAVEDGAFDVLDLSKELSGINQLICRAAWAACLKGAGHRAEAMAPARATGAVRDSSKVAV